MPLMIETLIERSQNMMREGEKLEGKEGGVSLRKSPCDSDYYNGEDWMMMEMIIHGRKSPWCRVHLIITINVM